MKSSTPRRTWESIVSGLVKRPTLTTGFPVMLLTSATKGSSEASWTKRETPISRL